MAFQWLSPNSYWKDTCIMSTTSISGCDRQACSCLNQQKRMKCIWRRQVFLLWVRTDKEQQSRARTAMLLRFQDLISSFKIFFFYISSSCIHKNLSFPLVSSQRTEKMPEVHVRQKLVCTFPAVQLKPHIIYKLLSRLWILILNGWICQYKARKISMKLSSWSNSINGAHKNQI